jgi:hypothetical protein
MLDPLDRSSDNPNLCFACCGFFDAMEEPCALDGAAWTLVGPESSGARENVGKAHEGISQVIGSQ